MSEHASQIFEGMVEYPIAGQYDTEPDVLAVQNQIADLRIAYREGAQVEETPGVPDESLSTYSL